MVNVRKGILCRCGITCMFELSTDMAVDDITISGRCPSCGSSLQITLSALFGKGKAEGIEQASEKVQTRLETENVEAAINDLFG
jgi:hypothetical protein